MTRLLRNGCLGLGLVAALAACDREEILQGERFGTRVPLSETLPADPDDTDALAAAEAALADEEEGSRPITLPAATRLAAWPQRGVNIRNSSEHAALSAAPVQIWATDIGAGNSRRNRITADPVMADGRIFTLDAQAGVQATGTDGSALWRADVTPGFERGGEVSGGGLAVAGDTLLATTGYGEIVALDVATGAERWRQRLDANVTTPTVTGDTVYVVSRDSQAWAVDLSNGRIRWQLPAGPAVSVLQGGAAPAVTDRLAIFPFGSGELVATLRLSGVRVWGTTVAGARRGVAYSATNDITGDPVVVGNTVYAGNQSGRVVALDSGSGERIWTAQDGAYSPVLPAGDSVFFVSDRNELIRLDAETGARIWGTELPLFQQERERRRKAVFSHYGPIMAGGRLIVASNDGLVRMYAPEDGSLVGTLELRGGAAANPIVAGDVMYIVGADGRLYAFR